MMLHGLKVLVCALVLIGFSLNSASAHFGMVIPSDSMVMMNDPRTISLKLSFSHPFEGVGMNLVKPASFFAGMDGKKFDLMETLKETSVMDHPAYTADFPVKRPGAYVFCMTPQPYWEPAEDCFIIHYTKTVVAAFGGEAGWDEPVGLKTEIVPLSKPFGLYAGNLFQGVVLVDGKPVPNAKVEVEYYNRDGRVVAPSDYMVAQTIKADGNGVFSYAAPAAGWWGFAALSTSTETMSHDGQQKDVELGAVLWVEFQKWQVKD